jgi:hypothetical protein
MKEDDMSENSNSSVKVLSAAIVGIATVGVAAYAGYKTYKQMKDIDLNNIFDDLNETFYNDLPKKET